ncbi:MAG: DinB family protein [Bacteroidota bacterium]
MLKRRPQAHESIDYFKTYIRKVSGEDFVAVLRQSLAQNLAKLYTLTEAEWNHKYADDKWTVKEVLLHIMDTERIFAYRALRIARNDKTPLMGFEQDDYVPYSEPDNRTPASLIEEYELLRRSTIALFQNMSSEMLDRMGTASGGGVSALALGFMTAGHEIHHWQILEERYWKTQQS